MFKKLAQKIHIGVALCLVVCLSIPPELYAIAPELASQNSSARQAIINELSQGSQQTPVGWLHEAGIIPDHDTIAAHLLAQALLETDTQRRAQQLQNIERSTLNRLVTRLGIDTTASSAIIAALEQLELDQPDSMVNTMEMLFDAKEGVLNQPEVIAAASLGDETNDVQLERILAQKIKLEKYQHGLENLKRSLEQILQGKNLKQRFSLRTTPWNTFLNQLSSLNFDLNQGKHVSPLVEITTTASLAKAIADVYIDTASQQRRDEEQIKAEANHDRIKESLKQIDDFLKKSSESISALNLSAWKVGFAWPMIKSYLLLRRAKSYFQRNPNARKVLFIGSMFGLALTVLTIAVVSVKDVRTEIQKREENKSTLESIPKITDYINQVRTRFGLPPISPEESDALKSRIQLERNGFALIDAERSALLESYFKNTVSDKTFFGEESLPFQNISSLQLYSSRITPETQNAPYAPFLQGQRKIKFKGSSGQERELLGYIVRGLIEMRYRLGLPRFTLREFEETYNHIDRNKIPPIRYRDFLFNLSTQEGLDPKKDLLPPIQARSLGTEEEQSFNELITAYELLDNTTRSFFRIKKFNFNEILSYIKQLKAQPRIPFTGRILSYVYVPKATSEELKTTFWGRRLNSIYEPPKKKLRVSFWGVHDSWERAVQKTENFVEPLSQIAIQEPLASLTTFDPMMTAIQELFRFQIEESIIADKSLVKSARMLLERFEFSPEQKEKFNFLLSGIPIPDGSLIKDIKFSASQNNAIKEFLETVGLSKYKGAEEKEKVLKQRKVLAIALSQEDDEPIIVKKPIFMSQIQANTEALEKAEKAIKEFITEAKAKKKEIQAAIFKSHKLANLKSALYGRRSIVYRFFSQLKSEFAQGGILKKGGMITLIGVPILFVVFGFTSAFIAKRNKDQQALEFRLEREKTQREVQAYLGQLQTYYGSNNMSNKDREAAYQKFLNDNSSAPFRQAEVNSILNGYFSNQIPDSSFFGSSPLSPQATPSLNLRGENVNPYSAPLLQALIQRRDLSYTDSSGRTHRLKGHITNFILRLWNKHSPQRRLSFPEFQDIHEKVRTGQWKMFELDQRIRQQAQGNSLGDSSSANSLGSRDFFVNTAFAAIGIAANHRKLGSSLEKQEDLYKNATGRLNSASKEERAEIQDALAWALAQNSLVRPTPDTTVHDILPLETLIEPSALQKANEIKLTEVVRILGALPKTTVLHIVSEKDSLINLLTPNSPLSEQLKSDIRGQLSRANISEKTGPFASNSNRILQRLKRKGALVAHDKATLQNQVFDTNILALFDIKQFGYLEGLSTAILNILGRLATERDPSAYLSQLAEYGIRKEGLLILVDLEQFLNQIVADFKAKRKVAIAA